MIPTEHQINMGVFSYEITYHHTSSSPDYMVIPSEAILFGVTQPEKAKHASLSVIGQ